MTFFKYYVDERDYIQHPVVAEDNAHRLDVTGLLIKIENAAPRSTDGLFVFTFKD